MRTPYSDNEDMQRQEPSILPGSYVTQDRHNNIANHLYYNC